MAPTKPAHRARSTPARVSSPSPLHALLDVRGPFLLPLAALLITRGWFATQLSHASEDAYITFRYAWNLAQGAGPVFNPGEQVYGFSSAPWMGWIAIGLKLGQDPLTWTRLSLVVADAVTLLALGSLLQRRVSTASAWCFCAALAIWPYFAALSMSGLEMNALVALIALSAWLVDRQHPAAGAVLGLLAVFRPEGLLAAAVLAVWAPRRDRLIAGGIAVVVFGALALYYGSLIPQSVRAKALVYGAPGPLHSSAWWDWALPFPLSGSLSGTSEGKGLIFFSLVASPAAILGAITLWRQRASVLTGAALAGCVVWLSYVIVGASFFFWYLAVPVFSWMLLVAVGLPKLSASRWLMGACAAALVGTWLFHPRLFINRIKTEEDLFGSTGEYLAQSAAPGSTVMLEPIGHIGWRARGLKLLDEVGLVTPRVSERRAQGAGWYADLLASERPDWIVVRAGLLSRGAAFAGVGAPFRSEVERRAALSVYEVAAINDTTAGDQSLVVLQRAAPR